MAAVVDFAFLGTVGDASRKTRFPPCRRRHPQRHALHDDNSRHGSKRPPLAVEKQLIVSPSLTLPKGRKFILAVL